MDMLEQLKRLKVKLELIVNDVSKAKAKAREKCLSNYLIYDPLEGFKPLDLTGYIERKPDAHNLGIFQRTVYMIGSQFQYYIIPKDHLLEVMADPDKISMLEKQPLEISQHQKQIHCNTYS